VATIQIRRGTAAQWTSSNPTLEAGEMGFETDTLKLKIGNGATAWTSLEYQITGVTSVNGQTGAVTVSSSGESDQVTLAVQVFS
jgi:hypothetical protein